METNMTDGKDEARRESRGTDIRAVVSRSSRARLTPERTAEIRQRILERAYDSPQIADTVARRILRQGDV
jgi:hypothetical protein